MPGRSTRSRGPVRTDNPWYRHAVTDGFWARDLPKSTCPRRAFNALLERSLENEHIAAYVMCRCGAGVLHGWTAAV